MLSHSGVGMSEKAKVGELRNSIGARMAAYGITKKAPLGASNNQTNIDKISYKYV